MGYFSKNLVNHSAGGRGVLTVKLSLPADLNNPSSPPPPQSCYPYSICQLVSPPPITKWCQESRGQHSVYNPRTCAKALRKTYRRMSGLLLKNYWTRLERKQVVASRAEHFSRPRLPEDLWMPRTIVVDIHQSSTAAASTDVQPLRGKNVRRPKCAFPRWISSFNEEKAAVGACRFCQSSMVSAKTTRRCANMACEEAAA